MLQLLFIRQARKKLAVFASLLLVPVWSAVALDDQASLQKTNSAPASGFVQGTNWNVGYWMWDHRTFDGQECHDRKRGFS